MNKDYKNLQVGYVFILIGLFLILYFELFVQDKGPYTWVIGLTFVVIMALFSSMTVTITDKILKIKLGIGLIQKTIDLTNVVESEVVRTKWYYSWGIRITPKGLMYNIFGLNAVYVKLSNGKRYLIGTNEPEKLYEAIKDASHKRE